MVILMKPNKTLVISKPSRFYEKENAIDKLVFYIPDTYEDDELKDFTVMLCYTSPSNYVRSELLVAQEESDKENFIEYRLPVTSKLTEFAGDVPLYLSLVHVDQETNKKKVMKTSVVDIKIETWDDYFKYVDDSSLAAIDNKLLALDNELAKLKNISEVYDQTKPDDLTIDEDGHLQLSAGGESMGDGVHVIVNPKDVDQDYDGVVNLDAIKDGIPEEPTPSSEDEDTTIERDLTINENGLVRLTINGRPVGNGVNVTITPEDKDEEVDGFLDLDKLKNG